MTWEKVLESLVAAGPLSLVCGAAVYVLWNALQKERSERVTDLRDMLKRDD